MIFVQLDYFETVLNAYFSQEAHQALKSLQGNLLDKACESASDETPGHHRRPTRGSDDPMADDRSNPSVSADDLLVRSLSSFSFSVSVLWDILKWPCIIVEFAERSSLFRFLQKKIPRDVLI